ncbi:MAG: phosphate acetyltransferase [Galactobacter sp.]
MAHGLYVSATSAQSGKSLIALGLGDLLNRHTNSIGFFRPITDAAPGSPDPMVEFMRAHFELPEHAAGVGLTRVQARELIAARNTEELYSLALDAYSEIAKHVDVVIVEGTDLSGHDLTTEFELNARLANHLGCHLIGVVSAAGLGVAQSVEAVDVARDSYYEQRVSLLSMIVNRANPDTIDELRAAIRPGLHDRKVYVIPETPEVLSPTIGEVMDTVGARLVTGDPSRDRDIRHIMIAAMNVGYLLERYEGDDSLLVTPADRTDVLAAAVAASRTPGFPSTSGVLVTGPRPVEASVLPILAEAPFPVYSCEQGTFDTTTAVAGVRGSIASGIPRKTAAALGAMAKAVDESELLARLRLPSPDLMTPVRFLHQLVERARSDRRRVVLPEGEDLRVLRAAEIIARRDICDVIVLGGTKVADLARENGVDLSGVDLVDPDNDPRTETFAAEYAQLRAHKGITLEQARERMTSRSYWGTMMVHLGHADGMVSGAAHTTADTIRPSLEFVKTRPGVKLVSSVFLMCLPDRVLVYGDCAVNPNPDATGLADIALASAATARQFGVDPKVAMLSYSTGTSGAGADVDSVREATALVQGTSPDFPVEGPIQYDAAVDSSIAASKLPGSDVAGHATVFVFPDLNTGNNTYKAVQQSAGAVAVGPVLQGLNKAVNDLSRGCTVADIVNTVAITAIQAQSLSPSA